MSLIKTKKKTDFQPGFQGCTPSSMKQQQLSRRGLKSRTCTVLSAPESFLSWNKKSVTTLPKKKLRVQAIHLFDLYIFVPFECWEWFEWIRTLKWESHLVDRHKCLCKINVRHFLWINHFNFSLLSVPKASQSAGLEYILTQIFKVTLVHQHSWIRSDAKNNK